MCGCKWEEEEVGLACFSGAGPEGLFGSERGGAICLVLLLLLLLPRWWWCDLHFWMVVAGWVEERLSDGELSGGRPVGDMDLGGR